MGNAVRAINRTYAGIADPGYSKTQAQSPLAFARFRIGHDGGPAQKNFAFREKQAFVRFNMPRGHNQRLACFRIGRNESGKLK